MSKSLYNPKYQYRHNAGEACFNTQSPAVTVFDPITLQNIRDDFSNRDALIEQTHKNIGNIPTAKADDEGTDEL
jgi:hypothetical protein